MRSFCLALVAFFVVSSSAGADAPRRGRRARAAEVPPPLTLAVTPDADRAFHVRVAVDVARDGLAEAVGDLRWLRFEVLPTGARRPLRCAYPHVPSRVDPSKSVASPTNGSALVDAVVDLRMYCVGAAFDAVASGARITPIYGPKSASANRFVARDSDRRGRRTANVAGASFAFVARPAVASESGLETRLAAMGVSGTRVITVRPTIVASREARIYLRPDAWLFDVRSPDGRVTRCTMPRHPVVPILDFFTRLRPRGTTSSSIDMVAICPGVFSAPGIYDVAAIADLTYDGGNVGLTAVTGTIRGRLSFIRVSPSRDTDPSELVREVPGASNAL